MQKIKIISWIITIFITISLIVTNVSALKSDLPVTMNGIDVSRYQGNINYSKVRSSGIKTVYIRAAYGTSKDIYFEQNYKNARDAGLNYGFYLFVTARTVSEARLQAVYFSRLIENTGYNCRPVMDFEDFFGYTNNQINNIGLAFLQQLETSTGIKPIIYTNSYSANTIWNKNVSEYYLWAAHYGVSEPRIYSSVWNSWVGFQYSSTGYVPGISGYVDLDKFTDTILINSTPVITEPLQQGDTNEKQYIVRSGDSLWSISARFNVSISSLVSYNNISNPDLIYPGQILNLDGPAQTSSYSQTYVIRKGDTLWDIANKYNVSVNSLISLNNIRNANLIYPGETLKINSSAVNKNPSVITVSRGDTLSGIASRYNTTVAALARINGISDPDLIYAGQTLTIV